MKFASTSSYIASDDLAVAVNAAVALQRPLLVKGEPGTGKTELARQVAAALGLDMIEWNVKSTTKAQSPAATPTPRKSTAACLSPAPTSIQATSLGLPMIEWNIKSTTKAQQGLYEYDAVSRLRDSQLGEARVHDVRNYIRKGKLWQAFEADHRVVLLIDEVDKADIEFPNDLLQELDRMEFHVYETGEMIRAKQRPVVIITSNNEKELPDAFLRRCFFHYIRFPDMQTLRAIVDVHFPGIKDSLLTAALTQFFEIRDTPGLKKKPSTSEVLDWLKLLLAEDLGPEDLKRDAKSLLPKLHGALLKNEQDVHLFERLAFVGRGRG